MLMQEERYKKHMQKLKNVKSAVDSGLNKTQSASLTYRISPMNSTMYANKPSAANGKCIMSN